MSIMTDNEQAYKWLAGKDRIHETCLYDLIISIYKQMKIVHDKFRRICSMSWCKRHKWRGNIIADILAKKAVEKHLKYQKDKSKQTTPISIKYIKHKFKNIMNSQNQQNTQTHEHIFSSKLCTWNIFNEYNEDRRWKNDLYILKKNYLILTQLRWNERFHNHSNVGCYSNVCRVYSNLYTVIVMFGRLIKFIYCIVMSLSISL